MLLRTSFWKVFRMIFVLFSLYLIGDALFRWDGFRYYASFSEFLPSVALISILWSTIALLTSSLVWLLLKLYKWFCQMMQWKPKIEHFLLFFLISGLLISLLSVLKKFVTLDEPDLIKHLIVLICAAVFLTWMFRNKAERWIGIIHDRITPLVWIFGMFVIISIPLVGYHTWFNEPSEEVSKEPNQLSEKNKKRPNILLITFDTLTARDMSLFGYNRETTPFISKWAKEAFVFTKTEAASNFTTPSTASLMTGKRVWTHQTYQLAGSKPIKSKIESMPAILKENEYYNMAFIVNPYTSVKTLDISNSFELAPLASEFLVPFTTFGSDYLDYGNVSVSLYRLFGDKIRLHDWIIKKDFIFDEIFLTSLRNLSIIKKNSLTTFPPEKAFNLFLKEINKNIPEPYFAWIHLFAPHYPYRPSSEYRGMFSTSTDHMTTRKEWIGRRLRYDQFIRYCDKEFEDFISQLTEKKGLSNTIIILSSDHGESFEHDYLMHSGPHLYEQVTHIPLIIKGPNQSEGMIINDIVEQIDIPATILDLANIRVPRWMEGRSLVPLLRGKKLSSKPVFSVNFEKNPSQGHKITNGTIAVWEGDYKLIHYLEKNESLLFNLKQDPDELDNLFGKETETGQRLLFLLLDHLNRANEKNRKK